MTTTMTTTSIEIQALGPNGQQYIKIVEKLAQSAELEDIDITIPDIESAAKWSCVIVKVGPNVPLPQLQTVVEQLLLAQKEEENKTDISIHNKENNVFYDLPEQWLEFVDKYQETSAVEI